MTSKRYWTAGATVALAFTIIDDAAAQLAQRQPEAVAARGETVITRARPELDPLGIRLGSFLVFPSIGLEETYEDNVFAQSDDDARDDFVTAILPKVAIQSDWSNHAFNFSTGADAGFYSHFSRLDYTDWFVKSDGRIDISRDAALFLGGGFAQEHEDPGDPEADVASRSPTEYDVINGFGRYRQQFGPFNGEGEVTVLRLDYDKTNQNAGTNPTNPRSEASNTGRDRTIFTFGGRAGYEFIPSYEGFVRVTGNVRQYDQKRTAADEQRSSEGYEAVVGIAPDLGGVFFGDVYAGYQEQFYHDNSFRNQNVGGFTAGGTLTWNATTLTTFTARAARTIEETTQVDSNAKVRTTAGLSADHELLRNLILSAAFTYTNDDYENIDREDNFYVTSLGARYLMNRYVTATVSYQYVHESENGNGDNIAADSDFTPENDQNIFRIGLEAHL